MAFGIFYIIVHLLAITTAISFVVSRRTWIWLPYITLLILEVPVLWRTLGERLLPVWLGDPISFGMAAVIFGVPFIRWWRTRELLQKRLEKRGLIFILSLHTLCAAVATIEGFDHYGLQQERKAQQAVRDAAIANDLSVILETVKAAQGRPEFPKNLQWSAIDLTINYSTEEVTIGVVQAYPEALTGTNLMSAIRKKQADVVTTILNRRPEVLNELKAAAETPLFVATQTGSQKILLALLEHLEPTDRDEEGRTLLMQAAYFGHLEILRFILEKYPDTVHEQDNHQRTALMHAVMTRGGMGVDYSALPAIVSALLEAGSSIKATDKDNKDTLRLALEGPVWSTLPQVVNQLLQAGAPIPAEYVRTRKFEPMKLTHFEGLSKDEQSQIWDQVRKSLGV